MQLIDIPPDLVFLITPEVHKIVSYAHCSKPTLSVVYYCVGPVPFHSFSTLEVPVIWPAIYASISLIYWYICAEEILLSLRMADKGLNSLLQWSIENSAPSKDSDPSQPPPPAHPIDAEALKSLMGGPSDADLMKEAMTVIQHPEATLQDRTTAFDNLEQLVENMDNANVLGVLGLWTPLVKQLEEPEADMRRMAAWCVGTAVQNNVKAQETFLAVGGIPRLTKMASGEEADKEVRRKAIYALSSEVRNYQPALDEAMKHLPKAVAPEGGIDAGDMHVVDRIIEGLRAELL